MSAYYNMNLTSLYAKALQKQAMSKTFNISTIYTYKYPSSNMAIGVNVSVQIFNISQQKGVTVGYYGQVVGASDRCSEFEPQLSQKASYITYDMVQAMWEIFSQTILWKPAVFDSTTLKSRLFRFRIVDLESIIPSALEAFPQLLDPLNVKCFLLSPDLDLTVDAEYRLLNTTLNWKCGIYRMNGNKDNLLSN